MKTNDLPFAPIHNVKLEVFKNGNVTNTLMLGLNERKIYGVWVSSIKMVVRHSYQKGNKYRYQSLKHLYKWFSPFNNLIEAEEYYRHLKKKLERFGFAPIGLKENG